MARILSVLPHAGGNVPPTLEILAELKRRGDEVVVLGHAQLARVVADREIAFSAFTHARPWSAVVERPGVRSMLGFLRIASDRGIARDVRAQNGFDLIIVDCMVPGALKAARATGAPVALVMHTLLPYWEAQWSGSSPMGLWLRATRSLPSSDLIDLALLTTMPELDPLPERTRLTPIAQTGPAMSPVPEPSVQTSGAEILISLSTISYPGQAELLQKLLDAVAPLPITALMTTGPSIDPATLRAPDNVELRQYVPHDEVLPRMRFVVSHGGHGTTMRALAHGVPVLVVPMSSYADHALVADALAGAGVGGRVSKHASIDELRAAIASALEDAVMRERAAAWGEILQSRSGAADAASALETLVGSR